MRIAQLSDFHFTRISWNPFRLFSKRIFGNLNWVLSRGNAFSEKQLDPLPDLLSSLKVDLILLGGDFATTSMAAEFEAAKKFIRKFKQPKLSIPGNHDHYTYRSYRQKTFYRYFSNPKGPVSNPIDFFNLKEQGVEAHRVSNWWVLLLDTSRATNPYSSKGLFSEKTETYLEEIMGLIGKKDPVLLLNHYPFFKNDEERRSLERGEALEELLRRHTNIRTYLHGHTHRHIIADLQTSGLPLILDSGSAAAGVKGSWNLLDIEEDGCLVTPYKFDESWSAQSSERIVWKRK